MRVVSIRLTKLEVQQIKLWASEHFYGNMEVGMYPEVDEIKLLRKFEDSIGSEHRFQEYEHYDPLSSAQKPIQSIEKEPSANRRTD